MTIDLFWIMAIGFALIAYIVMRDYVAVLNNYRVERKGRNWVIRDSRGRFVRITSNFFDVLSLGREL